MNSLQNALKRLLGRRPIQEEQGSEKDLNDVAAEQQADRARTEFVEEHERRRDEGGSAPDRNDPL